MTSGLYRPAAPQSICGLQRWAQEVRLSRPKSVDSMSDKRHFEWAILRRVIDLIQVNAKGAELGPVLETIENALRADQAKLIEAQ